MTRMKKQATVDALIDRLSAELVEEILSEGTRNNGRPWFLIARNKLRLLHVSIDAINIREQWGKK